MNNLKVERNKLYFERKYYYYLLWHGTEKPNDGAQQETRPNAS